MHVIDEPLPSAPPPYTESQSNYILNSAPPPYTPSDVSIISIPPANIPQSIIITEPVKNDKACSNITPCVKKIWCVLFIMIHIIVVITIIMNLSKR